MASLKDFTNHQSHSSAVSQKKNATINKAQGLAFNFDDPAEYLLGTIGSALFTEPSFYTDVKNLEELKSHNFNTEGLDEQAVRILNACFKVAESNTPGDLLALAHWARKELNMRTTPQVMLAVAAHCNATKPLVRKYVSSIAIRADEVKQVVAAYEHLFGWGSFPACLKKGVSDRMSSMTEYEILKYNTKNHPTFADLLRFCDRRKGYPFSSAMREYILKGKVIDSEATPMIASRKILNSMDTWSEEVPSLARRAGATWENLVSQFGSTREVWEFASTQMGYMALLRNLGNLLDADVSMATVRRVAEKLADPRAVKKSKQLPFRFLSAFRVLSPIAEQYGIYRLLQSRSATSRDRSAWDTNKVGLFATALETALENSAKHVPTLSGKTLIAADNSGSMSNMISKKSVMTIRDVANTLCAILHKRCDDIQVLSFGENVVPISLNKTDSILCNASRIAAEHNRRGGGHVTNAWKVFQYANLFDNKLDRIIILSDMQCYDSSNGNKNIASILSDYRSKISPKCFAHFFDLCGQGTRQTAPGNRLDNVVSGFSEKIFDQILVVEGAGETGNDELDHSIPSLDYVRKNY